MTRSLKDIVEDGFARLAVLSEKRKEILSRCSELTGGVDGRQCQQGKQRLESTEDAYSREICAYANRSQEVLQQSLSQIVEDNERFLSSVRENLQLRIAKVLKELAYNREWHLSGSSEKFVSVLRPLEREKEAGATDLRFESMKLFGELDSASKHAHSCLHEIQAEIAGRLSGNEHELIGSLTSDFISLIQESKRRRRQVTESMETLYSEQSSQMASLSEEMDERISSVVTQELESIKTLGKEATDSLLQISDRVVSSAASELLRSSQESFSELEASYEFSNQELTGSLTDLRTQTDELAQQLRAFLAKLEGDTKADCRKIAEKFKQCPAGASIDSASSGNLVEETLRSISRETDLINSDFKRQLSELIKMQQDRLSSLCAAAESAISAAATTLITDLKQLTRVQGQTWNEREQEMIFQLARLEKEAQESYLLISDSGTIAADDSVDGSV
jgi:hypothetical protein